jgi:hypothetical protein
MRLMLIFFKNFIQLYLCLILPYCADPLSNFFATIQFCDNSNNKKRLSQKVGYCIIKLFI